MLLLPPPPKKVTYAIEGFRRGCLLHKDPPDHTETLMMGHTGSPETLVPDQVMKQGKNPKTFIQQNTVTRVPSPSTVCLQVSVFTNVRA